MLPLTVRRVASSATQLPLLSPSAAHPNLASAVTAAVAASTQRRGGLHQRRYSSSKPSSPKNRPNASKDLPAGEAVTASAPSGDVKAPSEKRKRKSKAQDTANDPFQGFPSVPSTQHLSQEALGLSSFFSMHRPISITHSLPRTVTDDAFAEIFGPRVGAAKPANPSDVMSTLSRAVDDLEGPMAKMSISRAGGEGEGEGVQKIDLRHPDGRESSLFVQVKSMTGQFLPFQPPPHPEEVAGSLGAAAESEQDADLDTPQHRVYRAMFTIEETLDADGQVHVLAHSPKILGDDEHGVASSPARYIDRVRRVRYEDALRRREELHAVSVMKRRKLKMKKKKFKKKLKATRKQRERLHKL
ncbi:uncharacterized protein DNG_04836 [Cephalotrichum gorgonifer]|uniref:Small ribosomal subunit protein mS38 n=1 Tax=Cephalotrichum gorgonifer TaxID=2041049 RepID=A0AAE8MY51_9PEZI|nr:uncharacterized protein DNG_04836 [Cephalotrichum gorgonifer]